MSKQINPNEELIRKLMKAEGKRGNVKDFAILVAGSALMDYFGSYPVSRIDAVEGEGQMLLVHKRHLSTYISAQQAEEFWNPRLGIRKQRR